MDRGFVGDCVRQDLLQGKAVGVALLDPLLRVDSLEVNHEQHSVIDSLRFFWTIQLSVFVFARILDLLVKIRKPTQTAASAGEEVSDSPGVQNGA